MLSNHWQENNYERTGNNYHAWLLKSEELHISGTLLEQHRESRQYQTLTSELFLKGSSLECLFKAKYLSVGNKIVQLGKTIRIAATQSHNLLDLSRLLNIKFSDDEVDLLSRLTLYNKSGRYPIPKRWEEQKIQKLHGGGYGPKYYWRKSDDSIYESIRQKVLSTF